MIQKDKSASLRTNNYQTIFQPVYTVDQGAGKSSVSITEDKSPTLACTHDGAPAIAYAVESHPMDCRVDIDKSGQVQTLTSRMGTGGGNVPLILEPFSKSRRARSKDDVTTWKHGKVANTLNTFDQGEVRTNELVVESVGIDQYNGEETGDKSATLCVNCGSSTGRNGILERKVICLQGNGIDRADTAGCNGKGWKEDVSYTLNTIDRPAVAFDDYCIGNGQADQLGHSKLVGALNCMHDQQAVMRMENAKYIVRRLTPTECCRLQGFPDGWGEIDHKDSFSKEECNFWNEVRKTFAEFTGKPAKEYTEEQLLKWYNGLHTDSAEYKMWGNGIALPTALYVMEGIAEELNEDCD